MYAIQFHIPTGVISHQKTQRPPMSPSNIMVFPDIPEIFLIEMNA